MYPPKNIIPSIEKPEPMKSKTMKMLDAAGNISRVIAPNTLNLSMANRSRHRRSTLAMTTNSIRLWLSYAFGSVNKRKYDL